MNLIQWSLEDVFHQLQNIDIGLVSLFNGEWEKNKCGFKIINYVAAGIPPVASNVGESPYIIQDGVNGFICNDDQEWTAKLRKLTEDEALRRNMGLNARKTVKKDTPWKKTQKS